MKKYFRLFIGAFLAFWIMAMGIIVIVDPFFHYHAPLKGLYYEINQERYQNIGIAKHFEYDAIITGTSLTEDFKTSEFDELYGTCSVKLPFSGATYFETKQLLEYAYNSDNSIRIVLRSLDVNHLVEDEKRLREDLGTYPEYLYNDSVLDDLAYTCNEDVMIADCVPIIKGFVNGKSGGHTSFDDAYYAPHTTANWVFDNNVLDKSSMNDHIFADEDRELLAANVNNNIVNLAKAHPETTFVYFIPPYSVAWWSGLVKEGKFSYTCESIKLAVDMMLECENIKIYDFTTKTEITTDLLNYGDEYHYIPEINSMILNWIAADDQLITRDNYSEHIRNMQEYYSNYEYHDATIEAQ